MRSHSVEEGPVTVTGAGVLVVTVWRQKTSMTVHLVNLTNAMMMKGPLRELTPITEQRVRVKLPKGRKAEKVRLSVADKTPQLTRPEGYLSLIVPSILDHEVVAIDW